MNFLNAGEIQGYGPQMFNFWAIYNIFLYY